MSFLLKNKYLKKNCEDINFIEYNLNNGLRVILHKDNTNPIIALTMLYHVGSKNDSIGRSGFAHFFEHLMFEGSKNIKRGDYFKHVSANGGISNAYTNADETFYYEIFPSNKIELAIWLQSERMLHANVDIKGINIQKKVVKEEKKMYVENSPYQTAINIKMPSLLFKKHPYKFSVIGSMKDLDEANEKDYKEFYKKYYIPSNAILSIAGDINIKKCKKLIKSYFESIPNNTVLINRPIIGNELISKEIFSIYKDKNIQMPAVILGYIGPKKTEQDVYILKVIDNILSQGESSMITKNIINKKQLASYAGSFFQDLEDYGLFTIYAISNLNISLDNIIDAIDIEIEYLKKYGISKKELNKQINILEKNFIDNNISMLGIATTLSHYKLYYNNTNLINNILNEYNKINSEDIKRVSRKYLNKNQRVKLYNIPENYKYNTDQ